MKFRRKRETVEAYQVPLSDNDILLKSLERWLEEVSGVFRFRWELQREWLPRSDIPFRIEIQKPFGDELVAYPGDWIVFGIGGTISIYKRTEFDKHFELSSQE